MCSAAGSRAIDALVFSVRAMLHQRSHTSSESIKATYSYDTAAQTQLGSKAGEEATCTS
jgi:hypothetical protein